MAFDLEKWKRDTWANLQGWRSRLVPTVVNTGYVAVAAGVLWPLLYEARTGDAYGAAMTLMALTAGLGTNLISDQIRRWKDEANGEPDVAQWLQAHVETDAALRAEVDRVLEQLDALALARTALADDDRDWFEETLRRELGALGNLASFQASVNGDHNIVVQGEHNQVTFTVVERQEVHHHLAPDPRAVAADAEAAARRNYLRRFAGWCNELTLGTLGGEDGTANDLTLENVYISLLTKGRVPLTEAEKEERKTNQALRLRDDPQGEDSRPLTALEAASQHPRLVLLGDPGSGKSTFAKNRLRQLALAGLGLAEPPLGLDAGLLPVFVTLRDLVPRLAGLDVQEPLTKQNKADLIGAIFALIEKDVRDTARTPEFIEGLRHAIDAGSVALVLDGLDEVAYALRDRVRLAVNAFVADCRIQHVLITCRVRSYVGAGVFSGLHSETLAPLTQQHIRTFARRWYAAQPSRFAADQVEARSADLERAALDEDLFPLASNPMMLTSMAILHQRDIGLPRERVRLFYQLVDVLLRRWQKSKTEQLAEFLKDEVRLHATVERLAFEIHATGQSAVPANRKSDDAGDLSRGAALALLEGSEYLQNAAQAEAFLEYIDERSGLVIGRGGEPGRPSSYGFPHRTLQEYLAGRHMTGGMLPHLKHIEHAAEGDYWAQAAQYGAEDLLYNRHQAPHVRDLAYQLLGDQLGTPQQRRAAVWSGNYAALVGSKSIEADTASLHGGPGYLDRIRPALASLLASDLTPIERAEAGRSLAALGDQRDEAMTVEGMRLAYVPAGPFRMGCDKERDPDVYDREEPPHTLELPHYWIGVHPVTNAQFDAFVADGGYREAGYWTEAIAAEYWKDGWFKGRYDDESRDRPVGIGTPYSLGNHPAVAITWYEALAFTRWLNHRYVAQLPEGLTFGLPSEAEWEKAARGGLRIPMTSLTRALCVGLRAEPSDMQDNALPERRYPWPGDFDPNRANTGESLIGSTSPIGAFSRGASPYGCQDLAGNVWEWTRSHYENYPYAPADGREDLAADPDTGRVLRGGAFFYAARHARCAYRYWYGPVSGLVFNGFRVVASPFFSRL